LESQYDADTSDNESEKEEHSSRNELTSSDDESHCEEEDSGNESDSDKFQTPPQSLIMTSDESEDSDNCSRDTDSENKSHCHSEGESHGNTDSDLSGYEPCSNPLCVHMYWAKWGDCYDCDRKYSTLNAEISLQIEEETDNANRESPFPS